MYRNIILQKADSIATIILNRPEAMNAMNLEMFEELESAQKDIVMDKEIGRASCRERV